MHAQHQLVGALSLLNLRQQRLLEQAQHDYRALLEAHLVPLAQELNFGDTDRISVYKHDGHRFLELGRYSKNPDFHKTGRGVYPDNEGCLGRAWREGWAYVADLPDPKTEFNEYCHRQAVEYNISQLAVRGLTMRSLTYAALAIDSLRGDVRVAVIVCESTKPEDFSRDEVSRGFLTAGKGIVYFLEYMRPLEPSLDYANEEGF